MSPLRFWLVRHGPIAPPNYGRINGQRDVACDLSDGATLAWLAAQLPADAPWLTSHLSRTIETARAINRSVEPRIEPALAEQSFGDWEGSRWSDLHPDHHPVVARFWANPGENTPPGGESFAQVADRVGGVLDRLIRERAHDHAVIVAHAGTVRAALALALAGTVGAGLRFAVAPLSLTVLDAHDDGRGGTVWSIETVNRQYSGEGK